MEAEKLLVMQNIQKSFNDVQVLKSVDLDINVGEVHALMGENGAGKSTLIKILTGVYPKDGGKIIYLGKEREINSRKDAANLGIGVIYQDFSLIPTLSVVQNIMLGKEKNKFGFLESKKMEQHVINLIKEYGFDINPHAIVETLSIAKRQTVEILKALCEESSLIIMDEPTASLSAKESESLFEIINRLRDKGVSILYISHRLEEVFRLADRLTVLRDGRKEAVVEKGEINPPDVIRLMIGKQLSEATASNALKKSTNEVVLKLENLCKKGLFNNVSFEVHKGEILGIGGLVGAGRTEVLRCIYGADPYDSGNIVFEGEPLPNVVNKTIQKGFGLIPEDRRNQGFVPLLSIEKNIVLTNFDKTSKNGVMNAKKEKKLGQEAVKDLDIRPNNPLIPVGNLSGGNQQKAVLGKWLCRDLKVLLIDEPTAGIDIGAKDEIYKIIENLAKDGVAVILVSSDLQELLRVSTRIVVMRKGKVFKEFASGRITQEDILMAASGIQEKEA